MIWNFTSSFENLPSKFTLPGIIYLLTIHFICCYDDRFSPPESNGTVPNVSRCNIYINKYIVIATC